MSSLDHVLSAFARHKPSTVLSLLSEDEAIPLFPGLAPASHLKLYVERESCAADISDAARRRAAEIVSFARSWDGKGPILIHCQRGISRSTAAAFIIMCARLPEVSEDELIARIRRAAPHADPCPMLTYYADGILDRDGRMLDAVEDLTPPTTVLSAPPAPVAFAA
ncbi:MAG: tyrosine phosphatase family protein [Parvularculaceae bacterium]